MLDNRGTKVDGKFPRLQKTTLSILVILKKVLLDIRSAHLKIQAKIPDLKMTKEEKEEKRSLKEKKREGGELNLRKEPRGESNLMTELGQYVNVSLRQTSVLFHALCSNPLFYLFVSGPCCFGSGL